MSAIYSLSLDEQIFILTDAAVYDDEGILRAVGRKVRVADNAPFAITGVGNYPFFVDIAPRLCELPSFRLAEGALVTMVHGMRQWSEDEKKTRLPYGGNLLLAGFDDGKPRQVVACLNDFDPNFEPLSLNDIAGEYSATPVLGTSEQAAMTDILADAARLGAAFFEQRGADLFEVLRRCSAVPCGGTETQFLVGGQVDLTTIDTTTVVTTTLRTWPDEIGRKINPLETPTDSLRNQCSDEILEDWR